MKFSLSAGLLVVAWVVVGAVPQQSSSDMKDDVANNNVSDDGSVVEIINYSDQNCKDVLVREFYHVNGVINCEDYSSEQCRGNGEIGSQMYKCPAQETELDMKEYARLDRYKTEDCSGSISTTFYFPRKNAGKCISYDTYGNTTESQIFKLEGDKFSVGWSDCNKLRSYSKGKCVDKTIVHF